MFGSRVAVIPTAWDGKKRLSYVSTSSLSSISLWSATSLLWSVTLSDRKLYTLRNCFIGSASSPLSGCFSNGLKGSLLLLLLPNGSFPKGSLALEVVERPKVSSRSSNCVPFVTEEGAEPNGSEWKSVELSPEENGFVFFEVVVVESGFGAKNSSKSVSVLVELALLAANDLLGTRGAFVARFGEGANGSNGVEFVDFFGKAKGSAGEWITDALLGLVGVEKISKSLGVMVVAAAGTLLVVAEEVVWKGSELELEANGSNEPEVTDGLNGSNGDAGVAFGGEKGSNG